jgi:predicted nucleotidyltransferase component of viral defense system
MKGMTAMETTDKRDFNALVALAMTQTGSTAMKPVVEKEILHYDIFHALDKDGLLKNLVFQGGTSLRLCRGASRFSEDLDFAGGKDFSAAQMEPIKQCIETHIGARYGLKVEVKQPKAMARDQDGEHIMVAKWQISIETTPEQRDFPRQRINIEIANVPAYTRELMPLRLNYDFLLGYGAVLVNVESLNEIMADKVIAFPAATKYVRFRDIWDLAWLSQQGAKLDPALVLAAE